MAATDERMFTTCGFMAEFRWFDRDKITVIQFTDDNFKRIVVNENGYIAIKISLKLMPKWQQASIGLVNGLAPIRRQAIV